MAPLTAHVQQLALTNVPTVSTSDHKPVVSHLEVRSSPLPDLLPVRDWDSFSGRLDWSISKK
eukprot:3437004-Prymnesium_polylepis.1